MVLEGASLVPLREGISMLPLGRRFRDAYSIPFLPLTDAGETELPAALREVCLSLSIQGEVVYVEAEFHGGTGIQASVHFHQGGLQDPPIVASDAINTALHALGVVPAQSTDEFATIGLGEHRDTEQWLNTAGA
jgi:hypothetical protein